MDEKKKRKRHGMRHRHGKEGMRKVGTWWKVMVGRRTMRKQGRWREKAKVNGCPLQKAIGRKVGAAGRETRTGGRKARRK